MLCENCRFNTFYGPYIQRKIITDIFITRYIVRNFNHFVFMYLKRITLVKYVDFCEYITWTILCHNNSIGTNFKMARFLYVM